MNNVKKFNPFIFSLVVRVKAENWFRKLCYKLHTHKTSWWKFLNPFFFQHYNFYNFCWECHSPHLQKKLMRKNSISISISDKVKKVWQKYANRGCILKCDVILRVRNHEHPKKEKIKIKVQQLFILSLCLSFFFSFYDTMQMNLCCYAHGIKLNWFMLFFLIFLCSSDNCHNDAVVLCVCQKRKKILFNDFGEKRKGESLLEFPNIS